MEYTEDRTITVWATVNQTGSTSEKRGLGLSDHLLIQIRRGWGMGINWLRNYCREIFNRFFWKYLSEYLISQKQTAIIAESQQSINMLSSVKTTAICCMDRPISHYVPRSRLLNPPPAAQRHRHNLPSFREERQIHCSDKSEEQDSWTHHWIFYFFFTKRRALSEDYPIGKVMIWKHWSDQSSKSPPQSFYLDFDYGTTAWTRMAEEKPNQKLWGIPALQRK